MCFLSITNIGSWVRVILSLGIMDLLLFCDHTRNKVDFLKKKKSLSRTGITKTTSSLFVLLHDVSKGQVWLSWLVCLLRSSEKHLLLLHSWCNKSSKRSLKKKPIPLLIRNPKRNKMNSHNANTAVLCFELYCGILPYLEHFSSKEIFMFLQAFNF